MQNKNSILNHPILTTNKRSGPLPVNLKNDFIFKYIQQKDNDILKSISKTYLPFELADNANVLITNPIKPGDVIDSKTMILDVCATIDNNIIANYEMQVVNHKDWPERSISYLARCIDTLKKGESYSSVKAVYHVGFLNFSLFPDNPEFYANYKFLNVKTHIPYTSKFNITVVDLTHINLATDDDIANSRDIWASFFTSTTWEELYMLAERNSIINNAIVHIAEVSDEEYARMQYEAREDQLMQERDMKMYYENEIATRDNKINSLQDELSSLKELVLSLQEEINNK